MDPAERLQVRRKERDEKKDRERTLAFFQAAKQALDDAVRDSMDATMVGGIVDGLVSELNKRLRDDPQLHLLRNAAVCRAVEAAFRHNHNVLHTKATLFLLLGKLALLATSPTSSFVLEALLTNLVALVGRRSDDTSPDAMAAVAAETTPDGVGTHPGSGLPNAYALLEHTEQEVVDCIDTLLVDTAGSRSLRTLLLVLAGLPASGRPALNLGAASTAPIVFEDLLCHLAKAVVESVERVFMPDATNAAPRRADAWVAAAASTTSSLVLQTLLRCCAVESTSVVVRDQVEKLSLRGIAAGKVPLLAHLMRDPLGSHVFQAFLKIEPQRPLLLDAAARVETETSAASAFVQQLERKTKRPEDDPSTTSAAPSADTPWFLRTLQDHPDVFVTPWDVALQHLVAVLDTELLAEGSEEVRLASFLLQDFATFAPTLLHLARFWAEVVKPRLQLLVDVSALTAVLVRFTRKCAFGVARGRSIAQGEHNASSSSIASVLAAAKMGEDVVDKDVRNGAKYFNVPGAMRTDVVQHVLGAMKHLHPKGICHAVLVEQVLGEYVGFELLQNLLMFGPQASSMLMNAFDKLTIENVALVCRHAQGSFVMQQWIINAAQKEGTPGSGSVGVAAPKAAAPPPAPGANAGPPSKGAFRKGTVVAAAPQPPAPAPTDFPLIRRLARRLLPMLESLAADKYACHVVEVLYDSSPVDIRETLVQALVPTLQRLKGRAAMVKPDHPVKRPREEDDTTTNADVPAPPTVDDGSAEFYLWKVITKLCVEQYLHRGDEWRSQAARAIHVQKLMTRILAATDA